MSVVTTSLLLANRLWITIVCLLDTLAIYNMYFVLILLIDIWHHFKDLVQEAAVGKSYFKILSMLYGKY